MLPELESGGVETCTRQLADYLVTEGHDSVVVSAGGRMVTDLEAAGSRHVTFPVHRKSLFSYRLVKRVRQFIEAEKADILHSRSRVPDWIAFLAWRKMNPATRPRFVTSVHGLHSVNRYSRIVAAGERVICVSDTTHRYVVENYPKVNPDKLQVIHDGVDLEKWPAGFQPSQQWLRSWYDEFPMTKGRKLLLLPGRLTSLKGHEDFLRILAQAPQDCIGLFVGHCAPKQRGYRDQLMTLAAQLGVEDRTIYTGARSDLKEIFALSNIVYSLSTRPESFGLTTVEAMALGRPVIAYDHGGVSETMGRLLPEGLIPPRAIEDAAAKTKAFLTEPPRPASAEPFSLKKNLAATLALYRSFT